MSPEKIVYMANQIAKAFGSRTYDDAVQATAEHISNYWAPPMRRELFALMDADATRFEAIVRDARPAIRPVKPEAA